MLIEDPPLRVAIRFWWAITWRTLLIGIPFVFMGGMLGAMIGVATTTTDEAANRVASFVSFLPTIPVAIGVIQWVFGARFGQYKVGVVAAEPAEPRAS